MFDEKTIPQLEGSEETLVVRRGKKKNRRAFFSVLIPILYLRKFIGFIMSFWLCCEFVTFDHLAV